MHHCGSQRRLNVGAMCINTSTCNGHSYMWIWICVHSIYIRWMCTYRDIILSKLVFFPEVVITRWPRKGITCCLFQGVNAFTLLKNKTGCQSVIPSLVLFAWRLHCCSIEGKITSEKSNFLGSKDLCSVLLIFCTSTYVSPGLKLSW